MNAKYIGILAALAVACLLVSPAFSVGDGTGPVGDQNGNMYGADNGQGNGNCQGVGTCTQGQGCFGSGSCDGTGPNGNGNGNGNGVCDGTGPKRDGSCKAVA